MDLAHACQETYISIRQLAKSILIETLSSSQRTEAVNIIRFRVCIKVLGEQPCANSWHPMLEHVSEPCAHKQCTAEAGEGLSCITANLKCHFIYVYEEIKELPFCLLHII